MSKKHIVINSFVPALLFLMAFTTPAERPLKTITPDKLQQDGAATSICSISNRAFGHGETITYKLYYNWNFVWVAAGEVTFKVRELDDSYHLSAIGTTYNSYEWFYKVRDRYDTYVDKKTLLPRTSIRDILEGKYTLYDKTSFDQNARRAYTRRAKTKDQELELTEHPLNGCMHDIMSMIYYTRNMDFNRYRKGERIPIKIFMDKEVWPLSMTYHGQDDNFKVKGLGRFDAIHLSPELVAGEIFEEGAEMNIWVSDDENRIPLLIESPLSVGSVKAVLKDYSGLRHELTSAHD